jgi:ABC-type branched-subunit amino acid transport system ATPase component/branched-subunit amino acid ABC-type transport system permease component
VSELLPFIILGLTSGSVYGMAGVGLVLTYKTSGVFNFGFGAIGTLAAYAFYWLNVQHGVPWPVAALVAVVVLGVVLGLLFDVFAKRLATKALAVRIVATLGIVLIVQGAFTIIYGTQARTFPTFLPTTSYQVFGAFISQAQIIIMAIALVATVGLYVFFRRARMGIAMRAVVDDPDLLDLAGTGPRTVRRTAWIVGSMFALASGILLAQSVNLDPVVLTALVAQAYAAAAIGAFSSLPMTYLGGLVVGVASAVLTKYVPTTAVVAGIPASLPFILLFLVLVFMPKRRLATRLQSIPLTASSWSAPLRVHALWGVVALAVLISVPGFVGARLSQWTVLLAMVIMFLSLGLLVKTSGQVSLCQMGFGAIGAAAFAKLAGDGGLPWLVALICAGLVAVPIGALIAIPAIRLSGLYLALATFGFGLLLQNMFYNTDLMFGANGFGLPMPLPDAEWASTDEGFYYVVLAITTVVALIVVAITRTRLGRLLRALGDSPTALSTGGTGVHTTQVLVFCISAFLAAIAGALIGVSDIVVDGSAFDPTLSVTLLALILLSVGGPPWYALMQAAFFVLIPVYVDGADTTYYLMLVFGVFAVLTAFQPATSHVPRWVVAVSDKTARLLGYRGPRRLPVAAPVESAESRPAPAAPDREGIRVRDLRVQFGGLVAVDELALEAPVGRITGLIGPNGAGKTTTFDAICGLNSPARGSVTIHGRDLSQASPAARAKAGLGRTFQQMRLYDSLSVRQNVSLGREAAYAGRSPLTQVFTGPTQRRSIARAAEEAMALCGISDLADRSAGSLSTGQRRLVELARCLAGPFDLLLLDEPSSGLDGSETAAFADLLERVVRERGVGILLVEHDMSLVMRVCAYITVLDFGRVVFEGTPAQVAASPVVRAAYLGSEAAGMAEIEHDTEQEAEVSRS